MKDLREGSRLTYVLWYEQWSARDDSIGISNSADGGGIHWEFEITQPGAANEGIALRIFDDAFEAFTDIPEFFTALRIQAKRGHLTLELVHQILSELGATDQTQRVDPNKEKREEALAKESARQVLYHARYLRTTNTMSGVDKLILEKAQGAAARYLGELG